MDKNPSTLIAQSKRRVAAKMAKPRDIPVLSGYKKAVNPLVPKSRVAIAATKPGWQPVVGWNKKMTKVKTWGDEVKVLGRDAKGKRLTKPKPAYASHVTKVKDGYIHVMFAMITKWVDGGVKKIKYAGVLTRYNKLMNVSHKELRRTCKARLQNKPIKLEFSVPIPFSQDAGVAYVRNQIYRRGLEAKPRQVEDDDDYTEDD